MNFSCHCFSEAHDPAIHTPDLIYRHEGDVRAFQRSRFDLSLRLPDIIRQVPNRKVFFSRETNYLTVETVDQHGKKVTYTVFFDLKRARLEGHDLVMTVESAYVKEELPKHLDKISFKISGGQDFLGPEGPVAAGVPETEIGPAGPISEACASRETLFLRLLTAGTGCPAG